MLLPVLLVVGLWLGGHPEDLPGFVRSAFVADHQTRVVDEAIQRIAQRLLPADPNQQALGRLDRRRRRRASATASRTTCTPSEFREFNSPPHFTGIGVAVESRTRAVC